MGRVYRLHTVVRCHPDVVDDRRQISMLIWTAEIRCGGGGGRGEGWGAGSGSGERARRSMIGCDR